ncbi:AAA family ATPase [Agrobacterium rosae]|uniref:AAA family ATPase n=1 Tax=Agrobacterium rosae TaxID=1972867 RepID=UPI00122F1D16|nr:ATP-binding protein [Agrobacterium rosae]
MILRFSALNHLSFKNEVEISFIATSLKDSEAGLIATESAGPNKAILPGGIIYGANAAGKSNLIAAISCMRSIVIDSHVNAGPDDRLPYSPFALEEERLREPTVFDIDFLIEDVRYNYSFTYDAETIHHETLLSFPYGRAQLLFEREGNTFRFGRKLRGRNQIIAELTRPNSLFLSSATQNDHDDLTPVYRFFSDLRFSTSVSVSGSAAPSKPEDVDPRAIRFLNAIGTGVVDFRLEPDIIPEVNKAFTQDFKQLVEKHFQAKTPDDVFFDRYKLQLAHRKSDGGTAFLDFARESAGTRRLLFLLTSIFRVIDRGGVILVDELDASLHTQAFELVLAMFCKREYNRKGAQIIATVHDTNILTSDFMRRDQIWFAEKDRSGATDMYALSDIKLRASDNFERGYLEGRFGALPYTENLDYILGLVRANDQK